MRSAWLIALLLISPLHAAPPSRIRREAMVFHQAANRAFRAGHYEEAIEQLEAGYDTEPRPEFLIALAQTYRELGRLEDAIAHCERYLALAPRGILADQARHLAHELRAPQPSPPAPAASPAWVAIGPADSQAAQRVRRRDLTLGLVISSAGVLIGLAVGLGVGLSAGALDPPTRLGTISFQ